MCVRVMLGNGGAALFDASSAQHMFLQVLPMHDDRAA
jgi:hypothetical protein